MKYEGSMINHTGNTETIIGIKKNGCHLKITGHIDQILYVHTLGANVHHAQDMKFLSNLWLGGLSTDDANENADTDTDSGQQHTTDNS